MFFDPTKNYAENLQSALAPIVKLCTEIDVMYPDAYHFIDLNIRINEITCLIHKVDYDKISVSVEDLRRYPDIVQKLSLIQDKIYCLLNPDWEYAPLSPFKEWAVSNESICEDFDIPPSELESKLFGVIQRHEEYCRGVEAELMPSFRKLVSRFNRNVKEFYESIDYDAILMHIYDKEVKRKGQEIREHTDTEVVQENNVVYAEKKDYEASFIGYLRHLKEQSKSNLTVEAIYKAHAIHKPLSITSKHIKGNIFYDEKLYDKGLHQLISTIIKINYLKEKCGDIKPQKSGNEDNALSEIDNEILNRLLKYANKVDWEAPATCDKAKQFIEELFGVQEFRAFFKEGSGGHDGDRVVVAFANVLGFMKRYKLVSGGPKNISVKVFDNDNMVNNINHGKKGDASQAFRNLESILEDYRKKIFNV